MAWFPGATKMELQPESDAQAAIRPTQLLFHSIVGPWTPRRTYEYWRDSTNLESHFGVGYDGDTAQYIGTETRADANYRANQRSDGTGAVSVETASNTSASDPWTDDQIEALIRIGVWMHQHHGVPLRICRTADDPGFGYHRLHRAWSPSGTACPGPARIRQFHDVVFPGTVARATGDPTAQQEDDMPQTLSVGRTHWAEIPPREWEEVRFNAEWSDPRHDHWDRAGSQFVRGPAKFTGVLHVRADGLPVGAQLQTRLVRVDDKGDVVQEYEINEVHGTSGDSFAAIPIVGDLGDGSGVRVQVYHWQDRPVRIKAYVKALVWA